MKLIIECSKDIKSLNIEFEGDSCNTRITSEEKSISSPPVSTDSLVDTGLGGSTEIKSAKLPKSNAKPIDANSVTEEMVKDMKNREDEVDESFTSGQY